MKNLTPLHPHTHTHTTNPKNTPRKIRGWRFSVDMPPGPAGEKGDVGPAGPPGAPGEKGMRGKPGKKVSYSLSHLSLSLPHTIESSTLWGIVSSRVSPYPVFTTDFSMVSKNAEYRKTRNFSRAICIPLPGRNFTTFKPTLFGREVVDFYWAVSNCTRDPTKTVKILHATFIWVL